MAGVSAGAGASVSGQGLPSSSTVFSGAVGLPVQSAGGAADQYDESAPIIGHSSSLLKGDKEVIANPKCAPRIVVAKFTSAEILRPFSSKTQLYFRISVHGGHSLRSSSFSVPASTLLELALDLSFRLQYMHHLKGAHTYVNVSIKKKRRGRNGKTICLSQMSLAALLQCDFDGTLELFEPRKKGAKTRDGDVDADGDSDTGAGDDWDSGEPSNMAPKEKDARDREREEREDKEMQRKEKKEKRKEREREEDEDAREKEEGREGMLGHAERDVESSYDTPASRGEGKRDRKRDVKEKKDVRKEKDKPKDKASIRREKEKEKEKERVSIDHQRELRTKEKTHRQPLARIRAVITSMPLDSEESEIAAELALESEEKMFEYSDEDDTSSSDDEDEEKAVREIVSSQKEVHKKRTLRKKLKEKGRVKELFRSGAKDESSGDEMDENDVALSISHVEQRTVASGRGGKRRERDDGGPGTAAASGLSGNNSAGEAPSSEAGAGAGEAPWETSESSAPAPSPTRSRKERKEKKGGDRSVIGLNVASASSGGEQAQSGPTVASAQVRAGGRSRSFGEAAAPLVAFDFAPGSSAGVFGQAEELASSGIHAGTRGDSEGEGSEGELGGEAQLPHGKGSGGGRGVGKQSLSSSGSVTEQLRAQVEAAMDDSSNMPPYLVFVGLHRRRSRKLGEWFASDDARDSVLARYALCTQHEADISYAMRRILEELALCEVSASPLRIAVLGDDQYASEVMCRWAELLSESLGDRGAVLFCIVPTDRHNDLAFLLATQDPAYRELFGASEWRDLFERKDMWGHDEALDVEKRITRYLVNAGFVYNFAVGEAQITFSRGANLPARSLAFVKCLHLGSVEKDDKDEKADAGEFQIDLWSLKKGEVQKSSIRFSVSFLAVSLLPSIFGSVRFDSSTRPTHSTLALFAASRDLKVSAQKKLRACGAELQTVESKPSSVSSRKPALEYKLSLRINKFICSPVGEAKKPFKVYLDGREFRNVQFVSVAPLWSQCQQLPTCTFAEK